MSARVYAFWSINDRLEQERLRGQLLELKRHGYDGVIFHPRFYPNNPPYLGDEWMRVLSALILDARDAGMDFWIYDENGWPSGSVGGELLRRYPDARQSWLILEAGAAKLCRGDYLDMLDPAACQRFIELTYDRYEAGLDRRAFEYVDGFFTDEPQYGPLEAQCGSEQGFIPWTTGLPKNFAARYGHELRDGDIASLFFDADAELRVKFWELVTDLHLDAFYRPLNEWCVARGKRLTGHVKGEEHPLFQLLFAGSVPQTYRHLSLPAIDSLERHPRNAFFALELRSAARQFGDGQCLVEAFGGAGWGATPDDLLRHLTFFSDLGLTHFALHQCQYRLKSQSIFDWPPSIPFHVPWREAMRDVLQEFRLHTRCHVRPPAKQLLIAPQRGVMSLYEPWVGQRLNIHDGRDAPDSAATRLNARFMEQFEQSRQSGADFDISDERTFESASIVNGQIQLGKATYGAVIVGEGCRFTERGKQLRSGTASRSAIPITPSGTGNRSAPTPETRPVAWQLSAEIDNAWVFHLPRENDSYRTVFRVHDPVPLRLAVAVTMQRVLLNGQELEGATISPDQLRRDNELIFVPPPDADIPLLFVHLEGSFRLCAAAPYESGPNHTLRTPGPLAVAAYARPALDDLVANGFPFLRQPIAAEADVELPALPAGSRLSLLDMRGAAAQVTIDGASLGWTWPPSWGVMIPNPILAGRHRLRVTLAPSGQNFHGPHHHLDGDPHAVSPDQFLGRRNFLEPNTYPERTHVASHYFARLGIGGRVAVIR